MKTLILFSKSLVTLPLTDDLRLWLTGRIPNTFTPSSPLGVKITDIADSSGLGNDVSQPNLSTQPELDSINGFLAMETFTAGDRMLFRNDALGLTGNPALTIFIVIRYNSITFPGPGFVFSFGALSPSSNQRIGLSRQAFSNKYQLEFSSDTIRFSATAALTTKLISITFPGGASDHDATKLWLNGVAATKETSSSGVSNITDEKFIIGAKDDGFAFSDDQTIAEMIIYNKALSDTDRVLVENDLIPAYNIS